MKKEGEKNVSTCIESSSVDVLAVVMERVKDATEETRASTPGPTNSAHYSFASSSLLPKKHPAIYKEAAGLSATSRR